jgi:hypothetical protein
MSKVPGGESEILFCGMPRSTKAQEGGEFTRCGENEGYITRGIKLSRQSHKCYGTIYNYIIHMHYICQCSERHSVVVYSMCRWTCRGRGHGGACP